MIRAVLLDKDGTLTDFRATWTGWLAQAVPALAAEAGVDPRVVGDAIGYDLDAARIRRDAPFVTATGAQTAARVARAVGWDPGRVARWLAARSRGVTQVAVPGAAEAVGRLVATGMRVGVLTNADFAEAARHLATLGLAPHLERVIACDSGFGAKPDPRGAAAFADGFGLARAEVLLVGDGLADMAAAKGAGLAAVGVLTGTLDALALSEAGAEAVLPDVTHLPAWLDVRNAMRAGRLTQS